jgi:hypothetical protein
MSSEFILKIQEAGFEFDQYNNLGLSTFEKFNETFTNFPWSDQVGQKHGKSEPTISIELKGKYSIFWVSVIGDSKEYAYLVGRNYIKNSKTLFGFGKSIEKKWVEAIVVEEKENVIKLFELYINGSFEIIEKHFSKQEKFLSNEAPN